MAAFRRREWLGRLLKPYNYYYTPLSRAARFVGTAAASEKDVKVFASHCFYKGKGALAFHPGQPIIKVAEDGNVKLEKEGSMYLEFAPSLGPRQYDWNQKQIMALSVDEMGSLIALTMSDSIEFFHDPNLSTSDAGIVRKTLKIEPMNDKNGFFFNFYMANKQDNMDMHVTVPVTKGEFAVLRSSFSYTIPYLMGWHSFVNHSSAQLQNNQVNPNLGWSK